MGREATGGQWTTHGALGNLAQQETKQIRYRRSREVCVCWKRPTWSQPKINSTRVQKGSHRVQFPQEKASARIYLSPLRIMYGGSTGWQLPILQGLKVESTGKANRQLLRIKKNQGFMG